MNESIKLLFRAKYFQTPRQDLLLRGLRYLSILSPSDVAYTQLVTFQLACLQNPKCNRTAGFFPRGETKSSVMVLLAFFFGGGER